MSKLLTRTPVNVLCQRKEGKNCLVIISTILSSHFFGPNLWNFYYRHSVLCSVLFTVLFMAVLLLLYLFPFSYVNEKVKVLFSISTRKIKSSNNFSTGEAKRRRLCPQLNCVYCTAEACGECNGCLRPKNRKLCKERYDQTLYLL